MRLAHAMHIVLMPIALLALGACGSPPGGRATVLLAWRFADGRRCVETGASQMAVTSDPANAISCVPEGCQFSCFDGEDAPGVTVSVPAAGATLHAAALSPPGTALYRGDLSLGDPVPAAAIVILYFTGGP